MLKAIPGLSAKILVERFNNVWEEEREVSEAGEKLPKKGDLTVCSNWSGINFLIVSTKMFYRVLLQRLRLQKRKVLCRSNSYTLK